MTETEIPCSCVNILTQTSKCKDPEVETILISSFLSLSRAKAQIKLCPIISLLLRISPNKIWPHTNGKGALLRDKRCLIFLTVRVRMSGNHSRLYRVDEKKQTNMIRREYENVEQKLPPSNGQKKEVNFYNLYSLYLYIIHIV